MITKSIEINRQPNEVFAYIDQLERHGEWQAAIVSSRKLPEGPTHLGTHSIEMRKMPGGTRKIVAEVTGYDPPKRISAKGNSGSIQVLITISVDPIADDTKSKVTFDLDLTGRGIGKFFAIFGRKSSGKQLPKDLIKLKEILENKTLTSS